MPKGFMESIIPVQNETGDSKHLEKMADQIYNTDDVEVKTDLSQEQVNAVAKMVSFSEYFKIPILDKFANNYMKLMISKDRQSRKEFTQIATSANSTPLDEQSTFSKLIGKQ